MRATTACAAVALLAFSGHARADCGKISACPDASTPLAGTEQIFINQGGTTKKTALGNMAGFSNVVAETNAQLALTRTEGHSSIARIGFYTNGDTPPLQYRASGSACTLNAGAGDNGSQVPSADGKCWLADFPAGPLDARWFGAKGDNANNDTTPIQAIMNLGRVAGGSPGLTYRVTTALTCPVSGAGLSSITLYAPAASFNNTLLANKYNANAAVVLCQGQILTPFATIDRITLTDVRIQSEVSDGRLVDAVVLRNVSNPVVNGLEVYGFPVGVGLRFASLTGRIQFTDIHCHDWTTNVNWIAQLPQFPQITCIEGDNDVINGVFTIAPYIQNVRVKDLTLGAIALAASGYQTDGINLAKSGIKFARVGDVYIENVGEGVDNFSVSGVFDKIVIKNVHYYGIKNIHGASFNVWNGVAVEQAGIACAGFFGGAVADVNGNIVDGFSCNTVNQNTIAAPGSTDSCILFTDNSGPFVPKNNTVTDTSCTPGANGDYDFVDISTGTGNSVVGRALTAGRTGTAFVLHPENNNRIRSAVPTQLISGLTNAQTIVAGATAQVLFNLVTTDSLSEWSSGSHKWVAKFPGTYHVTGSVRFPSIDTGKTMSAFIYKNSSLALGFSQDYAEGEAHLHVMGDITVVAGDDLEVFVINGDVVDRPLDNREAYTYLHITQQ